MSVVSSVGLAPDPALPHRDVLLDPPAMRERLSAALGTNAAAHVVSPELVRVNYQVGRSLRAVYRAGVDGAVRTIAVRMLSGVKSGDLHRRSVDTVKPVGQLRGIAHDADLGAVFWVFPNDRKIGSLETILATATPIPGIEHNAAVCKRLVAYAPEKSATLVCEIDRERAVAYAKVTAAHQARRDYETYASLQATLDPIHRALRLPAPLAYSHEHRTLWLEAVSGRRMAESAGDEEIADLERMGAAVAAFHDLAAPHAPAFDRLSPHHLAADAAVVAAIRPDAADAARHLAARLNAAVVADDDVSCLHGDLHPKNAIVCAERLALIDVEDVARGPAAADIASLLASLAYRRETGQLSAAACRARMAAFLQGYAAHRYLPSRASLAWHTAAALFVERAARAVTRMRPLGLQRLPDLLAASERLLDRGLEAL
jgi:tRNA A-37 threonylcarbamoyl transferase component Bud32